MPVFTPGPPQVKHRHIDLFALPVTIPRGREIEYEEEEEAAETNVHFLGRKKPVTGHVPIHQLQL
jgi:hypothetical protein